MNINAIVLESTSHQKAWGFYNTARRTIHIGAIDRSDPWAKVLTERRVKVVTLAIMAVLLHEIGHAIYKTGWELTANTYMKIKVKELMGVELKKDNPTLPDLLEELEKIV